MIKTIILGIVQGLTEFLPVSSSGHLAILEKLFGIGEPVTLAVFLHLGTLMAILVFFRAPIIELAKGVFKGERNSLSYLMKIAIGSIPIVVFAIFFGPWVSGTFKNVNLVAILLGITGAVVLLTRITRKKQRGIGLLSAILIGIGQMFAILPGISRSGMTISAGIFSGVEPKRAFRFSFLLSVPAVLGANIFELKNVSNLDNFPELVVGMVFSFISGLVALRILRGTVYRRFYLFGPYCLILSIVLLFVLR